MRRGSVDGAMGGMLTLDPSVTVHTLFFSALGHDPSRPVTAVTDNGFIFPGTEL